MEIPDRLRNVLRAMGYTVLHCFSNHTCEEHFAKIEKFMQEKLHILLDPTQWIDYYGVSSAKPELYELVEGTFTNDII